MPQPFKQKVGSHLQRKHALEARPKCAVQIACIAAAWTEVEENVAGLFWTLSGHTSRVKLKRGGSGKAFLSSPNPTAVAIMNAVESSRVKTAMLRAALEMNAPALLDEFDSLNKEMKKVGTRRNAVVHGSWYASDQYPNDAILEVGKSKLRYTEKDLREIVSRIHGLSLRIRSFRFTCMDAVAHEQPE